MRLTNHLPARRAASTFAAVTLGLVLGAGITAQVQTNDQAQGTGTIQAPEALDQPGQEPTQPPQQPAAPGQPPPATPSQPGQSPQTKEGAKPPQQPFTTETAMIFYQVLPDKTTQFEQLMTKVKDAMQQSDNATRKQQAEGMRLLKANKPAPDGSIQYVLLVHPVVKDAEYAPGMLVYETFPSEANKLFTGFESFFKKDGLTGAMELEPVLEFGSGAAAGAGM